jgi:glycogen debranching enzyme
MALSTNCLYAEAYRLEGQMAEELGVEPDPHAAEMHLSVCASIQKHFWQNDLECFRYYLDPWGGCGGRQETLGNAFAILFGIATPEQAANIAARQPHLPFGPPAIWPEWERYAKSGVNNLQAPEGRHDIDLENRLLAGEEHADTVYGGHGATVWPMIQGYWAHAALLAGDREQFEKDLGLMATQFCRAVQSPEVVHPDCGLPYGGVQEDHHAGPVIRWVSCYRQTWSATSLLRLILNGVLGIRWEPEGMVVSPTLPLHIHRMELRDLPYRNARLTVQVERASTEAVTLNGTPLPDGRIPADLEGDAVLHILLASVSEGCA